MARAVQMPTAKKKKKNAVHQVPTYSGCVLAVSCHMRCCAQSLGESTYWMRQIVLKVNLQRF